MLGYISGRLMENNDGTAIVLVEFGGGPSAGKPAGAPGIGYEVQLPTAPRYLGLVSGEPVRFFLHTHVREDQLDLYGFLAREEKEIFTTLLTVNGIGPKGALGILSKVEIPTLIHAILNEDKDSLTQIPGIGKKTAERVVLELQDKMRKKLESGAFPADWLSAPAVSASGKKTAPAALAFALQSFRDAKTALAGLGYRDAEIGDALKRVESGSDGVAKLKAEEVVKLALKELL